MLPNISENFLDICRLCLIKGETLKSIFDLELNNANEHVLVNKILKCLNIEIKEEDIISKQICEICLENVDKFYEFRNRTNGAQEVLKEVLNNLETSSNEVIEKETQDQEEEVINCNEIKNMPLEVDDLDNEVENCFLEELDAHNTNCKDPLALDEHQDVVEKAPHATNSNSILINNQLVINQNSALQSTKTQPQVLIFFRKTNNGINQTKPQQINTIKPQNLFANFSNKKNVNNLAIQPQQINVIKPQNLICNINNLAVNSQQINSVKPQNLFTNFNNQQNVKNLTIQPQQINVIKSQNLISNVNNIKTKPQQINTIKPQINLSNLQNISYLTTPSPINVIKPQTSGNNLQNLPNITNLKTQTTQIKFVIKPQNLISNFKNAQNAPNISNITTKSQVINVIKPQSNFSKLQNVSNISNLKATFSQTNNIFKAPIIDNTGNFQRASNISNQTITSNRQSISNDSKEIINNSVSNTDSPNIKAEKQKNPMEASSFTDKKSLIAILEEHNICEYCGKYCEHRRKLVVHRRRHTGERPFKCDFPSCIRSFPSREGLASHKKSTHSDKRPFSCKICHKSYKQRNNLTEHIKTHGERNLHCDLCNYSTFYNTLLLSHKKRHKNNYPYSCKYCDKGFFEIDDLEKHKILHNKIHTCYRCNENFSDIFKLREHKKEKHKKVLLKKCCPICPKTFWSMRSVKLHIKGDHQGLRYYCYYCPIQLKSKPSMRNHIHMHLDIKPFKCDLCKKRFISRSLLKTHKIVHSKEKRYICSICDKKYSQRSGLNSHNKKHHPHIDCKSIKCNKCGIIASNELSLQIHIDNEHNRYECYECGHIFKNKFSIIIHLRKHTGYKPYECSICKECFINRKKLKLHNVKHSLKIKSEEDSQNSLDFFSNKFSINSDCVVEEEKKLPAALELREEITFEPTIVKEEF